MQNDDNKMQNYQKMFRISNFAKSKKEAYHHKQFQNKQLNKNKNI